MQPDGFSAKEVGELAFNDSVENCLAFFKAAVPVPSVKNMSTQLGCHFEEVREMLQSLRPGLGHIDATYFINQAADALHALANLLKADETSIGSVDRVEFIDAVADQMVTAIGSAYMFGMDPLGAFNEVNASNLSKFDEHGQPIFDENMKVSKGPMYKKAVLEPFAGL